MALPDETKTAVTGDEALSRGAAAPDSSLAEPRPEADIARPQGGFINYLKQHPKGFWFIFWGEFAERCSFYGVRAILARYMAEALLFKQEDATTFVSFYLAAAYFLPILGGWLADNFFGKYNIIVAFSLPYILGHVIMSVEDPLFMFIALTLLAMGSGVIKPNISSLMGMTYDQYRPGQESLRSHAFSMFYMAINIGSTLSYLFLPRIRTAWGYSVAFMVPAAAMAIAFVLFAMGKKYYAREVIVRKKSTPEERAMKWRVVGRVSGIFILCSFFWAVYDQSSTTWVFFANDYMDLHVFGFEPDPEFFGFINPFLIVPLVPLIAWLFHRLEKRGIKVRATQKMLVGFVLTAVCMGVMALSGMLAGTAEERPVTKDGQVVLKDGSPVMYRHVEPAQKVTIWWQVLALTIITVAEILVSVTGLEMAFVVAPASMKSFVTGLWLVSVSLGNFVFNAPVARLYNQMEPGPYFAMLTLMMVGVTIVFVFVAQRFDRAMAQMASEDRVLAAE
jgi:dipeptide/tripeptide permease